MQASVFRWGIHFAALLCGLFLAFSFAGGGFTFPSNLSTANLQTFKTMFIGIILEAVPFILLGVAISSILQVFVSEKAIARWVPRGALPGILFACALGIFFPVCECGLIPIVRRLMRKGMPAHVAMVFILSGPIVNPVVYAATYTAFRTHPDMAYSRLALAFLVSVGVGLVLYRSVKVSPLRSGREGGSAHAVHTLAAGSHSISHSHSPSYPPAGERHETRDSRHDPLQEHRHYSDIRGHDHDHDHRHGNRFASVMNHAADEFFEMGRFLVLGALLTALIQTVLSREMLVSVGQDAVSSHFFMMGFAYILSLCSTSDAFVASSFMGVFSKGSLLAFLVFGPMLDLKSTFMLLSVFKTKFVLLFMALIAIFVLVGTFLFEKMSFV